MAAPTTTACGDRVEKLSSLFAGHAKDTSLEDATFRLPACRPERVAIVHRPAAVGVVPVRVRDGVLEVLLVRQPRPAGGEEALVAGKIDDGEDPIVTAQRELAEEVGLQAAFWLDLALNLLPSPGFLQEHIHLYAAWDLTTVASRGADAYITGEWVDLQDAIRMVVDREIRDMTAIIALFLVNRLHHTMGTIDSAGAATSTRPIGGNRASGKTSALSVLNDPLPEQDPNLDNGWVVSDNLHVFAGHDDGFPVVWVDAGDTATVALSPRQQQRTEAVLRAARRRAEELANEYNAAQQDERDGLVVNP